MKISLRRTLLMLLMEMIMMMVLFSCNDEDAPIFLNYFFIFGLRNVAFSQFMITRLIRGRTWCQALLKAFAVDNNIYSLVIMEGAFMMIKDSCEICVPTFMMMAMLMLMCLCLYESISEAVILCFENVKLRRQRVLKIWWLIAGLTLNANVHVIYL